MSMTHTTEGGASHTAPVTTKEEIRDSTVRLIRTLVTLAQTLKSLPQHRYITVKLQYRDGITPEDYEPQYFRPGAESDALVFEQRPFKVRVGEVKTRFHEVSVKMKSIADSFVEGAVASGSAAVAKSRADASADGALSAGAAMTDGADDSGASASAGGELDLGDSAHNSNYDSRGWGEDEGREYHAATVLRGDAARAIAGHGAADASGGSHSVTVTASQSSTGAAHSHSTALDHGIGVGAGVDFTSPSNLSQTTAITRGSPPPFADDADDHSNDEFGGGDDGYKSGHIGGDARVSLAPSTLGSASINTNSSSLTGFMRPRRGPTVLDSAGSVGAASVASTGSAATAATAQSTGSGERLATAMQQRLSLRSARSKRLQSSSNDANTSLHASESRSNASLTGGVASAGGKRAKVANNTSLTSDSSRVGDGVRRSSRFDAESKSGDGGNGGDASDREQAELAATGAGSFGGGGSVSGGISDGISGTIADEDDDYEAPAPQPTGPLYLTLDRPKSARSKDSHKRDTGASLHSSSHARSHGYSYGLYSHGDDSEAEAAAAMPRTPAVSVVAAGALDHHLTEDTDDDTGANGYIIDDDNDEDDSYAMTQRRAGKRGVAKNAAGSSYDIESHQSGDTRTKSARSVTGATKVATQQASSKRAMSTSKGAATKGRFSPSQLASQSSSSDSESGTATARQPAHTAAHSHLKTKAATDSATSASASARTGAGGSESDSDSGLERSDYTDYHSLPVRKRDPAAFGAVSPHDFNAFCRHVLAAALGTTVSALAAAHAPAVARICPRPTHTGAGAVSGLNAEERAEAAVRVCVAAMVGRELVHTYKDVLKRGPAPSRKPVHRIDVAGDKNTANTNTSNARGRPSGGAAVMGRMNAAVSKSVAAAAATKSGGIFSFVDSEHYNSGSSSTVTDDSSNSRGATAKGALSASTERAAMSTSMLSSSSSSSSSLLLASTAGSGGTSSLLFPGTHGFSSTHRSGAGAPRSVLLGGLTSFAPTAGAAATTISSTSSFSSGAHASKTLSGLTPAGGLTSARGLTSPTMLAAAARKRALSIQSHSNADSDAGTNASTENTDWTDSNALTDADATDSGVTDSSAKAPAAKRARKAAAVPAAAAADGRHGGSVLLASNTTSSRSSSSSSSSSSGRSSSGADNDENAYHNGANIVSRILNSNNNKSAITGTSSIKTVTKAGTSVLLAGTAKPQPAAAKGRAGAAAGSVRYRAAQFGSAGTGAVTGASGDAYSFGSSVTSG